MYKENTLELYKKLVKQTNKESKKTKIWFYNLLDMLETPAYYNMSFGIRSNGKTSSVYILALIDYVLNGNEMALIRRWELDFKGKKGREMFSGLDNVKLNGKPFIEELTEGKWTGITYFSSQWFLSKFDEKLDRVVRDENPFCHGFALSVGEHDKSTSYPRIRTILFDEFITRDSYHEDEFVRFMNTISTIVREKAETTIFMCGNTVNKYCPHFKEMGLYNIKNMKPDTIDRYSYGESGLTVNVEYTGINEDKKGKTKSKPSDVYYAFNNPKLKMITTGAWEIDVYPHLPTKYDKSDIKGIFFIVFEGETLQCEIVDKEKSYFIYIHRKTTPLKDMDNDLIYSQSISHLPNHNRKINRPRFDFEKKIWWLFKNEKIFYQDNDVGEIIRNYLLWCEE